ncbi:HAD-IA family hydrolase [Azoarcus sp. L1K30]|uniref:HAD-IA family hydrolase n=1 Tax=Azoarcus sp. L1K30 TaxID=2820277 RepID=UPI002013A2DE|nr:HAD-IA family hydrolase [Azoarcus sp. L1K30]
MRMEAVIFDCDGTLVDSEGLAVEVIVGLLDERGIRPGYDALMARFHGGQFSVFVDALCQDYPTIDPATFTAEFRSRTQRVFRRDLKAMPGARALVSTLDIEKCVASNGPLEKIETSLGATGLLQYFDNRIVSAYEVGSWKPDPGLVHAACASMGVPAARCLLIEDSLPGVRAGLAAGVAVAAFRLGADRLGELAHKVQMIDELAQVPLLLE